MQIKFYGMDPLSLVDLDGMLTCTLFTAGCNFRCPFCHNEDLVKMTNLKELQIDEILDYLKERKTMLDAVCITGGEPTLYYLTEVLKKIKALGYFIKLDTNGTNPDMIKELYEKGLIDYCAMDIKNTKPKYEKTIESTCDLTKIEESINYLKTSGIDYEFRTTAVKELHDSSDFLEIAKWLGPVKRYYIQKFVDQGHCLKKGYHEISEAAIAQCLKNAQKYIPSALLRGY